MADAFFIIIQTLPADPVPVPPLGMLLQDHLDNVMIRVLQKDHQIVFHFFLANRAYIIFHRGLSPGGGYFRPLSPVHSLNELGRFVKAPIGMQELFFDLCLMLL